MDNLQKILPQFALESPIREVKALTNGHIHTTYRILLESGRQYTLQAMNTFVFHEPEKVMANILRVTRHLRRKLTEAGRDPERECLTVVLTQEGKPLYRDEQGRYWRIYQYIDHAKTYETIENPAQLYRVGYGFGRFQTLLADFDMTKLHDTIPDFHNTRLRLQTLFEAVRRDSNNRAREAGAEIAFLEQRAEEAGQLVRMTETGELPLRVVHNDTKINNILMDDQTGEALCVIDLDTVMPGLAAVDFGDAIRFAANTAVEDERDLSRVALDMELYESYTRGFLAAVGNDLTERELRFLPHGAKIITLELAARFLTDYLEGDSYFRIHRPGQNLDRARCQIQLARSMEERFEAMCRLVEDCRLQL